MASFLSGTLAGRLLVCAIAGALPRTMVARNNPAVSAERKAGREVFTSRSFHKHGDGLVEGGQALALLAASLKVDPAFVEAIDHADARKRVLHAFSAEARFPRFARHRLHMDRMAQRG